MSVSAKAQAASALALDKDAETAVRKRGRPRKYSREQLVDLAIELVDEGGYGGLSVRALARRAKIIPPTLYRYFRDVDDLTQAVAERLLPPATQASPDRTPRQQLVDHLLALRETMLRHPQALACPPGTSGWQRQIEGFDSVLELLSELPQTPGETLEGIEAIFGAIYLGAEQQRLFGDAEFRAAINALPRGAVPHFRAGYRELARSHQKANLTRWLNRMIDRLLPGIDDLPSGPAAENQQE